jgi:hypothetical protein
MQVHPNQVQPAQNFDVVYFLGDHTDSTTYYVRAVVYDVRTGDILTTENLTESPNNSRLFANTIQAPPDPIGYGRNIVAIVTVYTDSGYTTKSDVYQELSYNFLVKAEQLILGGGGVDHEALKEIFEKALEQFLGKLPKPDPTKPLPEMPFPRILQALSDVKTAIDNIPKPELDLSPILNKMEALRAAIKMIPEPDPVDLKPMTSAVANLEEAVNTAIDELRDVQNNNETFLKSHEKAMGGFSDVLAKKAEDAINAAAKKIDLNITLPMSALIKKSPREEKEESIPFDIKQLTG